MVTQSDSAARVSGRIIGIVGLCVGVVSAVLIAFATVLMGADTGSSFVGPTDHVGLALLGVGVVSLVAGVALAVRAMASPASRTVGIAALVASLSGIPLAVIALVILDVMVG